MDCIVSNILSKIFCWSGVYSGNHPGRSIKLVCKVYKLDSPIRSLQNLDFFENVIYIFILTYTYNIYIMTFKSRKNPLYIHKYSRFFVYLPLLFAVNQSGYSLFRICTSAALELSTHHIVWLLVVRVSMLNHFL